MTNYSSRCHGKMTCCKYPSVNAPEICFNLSDRCFLREWKQSTVEERDSIQSQVDEVLKLKTQTNKTEAKYFLIK